MHPGSFSATSESLTASGLLSIKNGHGFPRTLCGVTCIWFDLVMKQLLLQERAMSVLDEFNSSELI